MSAEDKVRSVEGYQPTKACSSKPPGGSVPPAPRTQEIYAQQAERIAALEAELVDSKRLNAKWMDERTAAIIRAKKAESERDEWRQFCGKWVEVSLAEAATLRRMLLQTYTDYDMTWLTGDDFEESFQSWFTDLRTRLIASEGDTDE